MEGRKERRQESEDERDKKADENHAASLHIHSTSLRKSGTLLLDLHGEIFLKKETRNCYNLPHDQPQQQQQHQTAAEFFGGFIFVKFIFKWIDGIGGLKLPPFLSKDGLCSSCGENDTFLSSSMTLDKLSLHSFLPSFLVPRHALFVFDIA